MHCEHSILVYDNGMFYVNLSTAAALLGLTRADHGHSILDWRKIRRLFSEVGVYDVTHESYISEDLCLAICGQLKDSRAFLRFSVWLKEQKMQQQFSSDVPFLFEYAKIDLPSKQDRWVPLPAAAKQVGISRKDFLLFMVSSGFLSCTETGELRLQGKLAKRRVFRGHRGTLQVSVEGIELVTRTLPQKEAMRGKSSHS